MMHNAITNQSAAVQTDVMFGALSNGLKVCPNFCEAELDLSRFCAAPSACLSHLSFAGDRPCRTASLKASTVACAMNS